MSPGTAARQELQDLARRNAHLAVLVRVAELAGEVSDLPAFFAKACEVVRPVAGYTACAFWIVDEAAGDLARVHLDGRVPPEFEPRIRRSRLDSPLGEVVRTRAAQVTRVPYPGGTPGVVEAMPFQALAWVPLIARSRGVGALVAGFDGEGATEAAQASLELLTSVGAHFASALESHGLLADLRRRVDEQTLLLDLARASAQLDPTLVLEGALRRVCATTGAEVGAAWLRENDRLVLQSSAGLSDMEILAVAELPLQGAAAGLAVERRAPVRVPAAQALGAHLSGPRCAGLGDTIAVPLVAKAEPIGALLLARRR